MGGSTRTPGTPGLESVSASSGHRDFHDDFSEDGQSPRQTGSQPSGLFAPEPHRPAYRGLPRVLSDPNFGDVSVPIRAGRDFWRDRDRDTLNTPETQGPSAPGTPQEVNLVPPETRNAKWTKEMAELMAMCIIRDGREIILLEELDDLLEND